MCPCGSEQSMIVGTSYYRYPLKGGWWIVFWWQCPGHIYKEKYYVVEAA